MIDQETRELEFTVGTPGWQTFVVLMREGATRAVEQLLNPSQVRKDRQSDDFLRGYVKGLREAVRLPEKVVKDAITREGIEATPSNDYDYTDESTSEE